MGSASQCSTDELVRQLDGKVGVRNGELRAARKGKLVASFIWGVYYIKSSPDNVATCSKHSHNLHFTMFYSERLLILRWLLNAVARLEPTSTEISRHQ